MTPMIRRCHGDTALWVGTAPTAAEPMERCMIRHAMFVGADAATGAGNLPGVVADAEHLPFKSSSIDALVLHHALEIVADPRVALRETARVLAPGGRLLIAGFNPWSLVGLRRIYGRVFDDPLSARRLVNPLRLFDWLTVLGLELDRRPKYLGPGLLLGNPNRDATHQESLLRMPFGGLLLLSAVKQTGSVRMPRTMVPARRRLAPVAYPRIASWQRSAEVD